MLADPYIAMEAFGLKITELSDIAKIFSEHTKNSDVLLLSGHVGSGKTEFARLVIKAKAIKEHLNIGEISSPTFSLIQSYDFQYCQISHIDLYRVNSEVELYELGIPDIFGSQITLLEWPEILERNTLSRYVSIKIQETKKLKDCRDFTIEFFGHNWDDLSEALVESKYFYSENK